MEVPSAVSLEEQFYTACFEDVVDSLLEAGVNVNALVGRDFPLRAVKQNLGSSTH